MKFFKKNLIIFIISLSGIFTTHANLIYQDVTDQVLNSENSLLQKNYKIFVEQGKEALKKQ